MSKRFDKTGERRLMNCGYWCEIIKYNNARDIVVRFDESGYTTNALYDAFKMGKILDKLQPTLYEIGIIGNTKTVDDNGKPLNSYKVWTSMFTRCYETDKGRNHTYDDCYVCDEWKCYEDFKKWYEDNYYEIDNGKMCLDKDILIKGNRVYSPDTCVFVPPIINLIFGKCQKRRGELPIGVSKKDNRYIARVSITTPDGKTKSKYIGCFKTPEDAFNKYKESKEEYIKEVADRYKSKIPNKLYDAMYKYEVEITD